MVLERGRPGIRCREEGEEYARGECGECTDLVVLGEGDCHSKVR